MFICDLWLEIPTIHLSVWNSTYWQKLDVPSVFFLHGSNAPFDSPEKVLEFENEGFLRLKYLKSASSPWKSWNLSEKEDPAKDVDENIAHAVKWISLN